MRQSFLAVESSGALESNHTRAHTHTHPQTHTLTMFLSLGNFLNPSELQFLWMIYYMAISSVNIWQYYLILKMSGIQEISNHTSSILVSSLYTLFDLSYFQTLGQNFHFFFFLKLQISKGMASIFLKTFRQYTHTSDYQGKYDSVYMSVKSVSSLFTILQNSNRIVPPFQMGQRENKCLHPMQS